MNVRGLLSALIFLLMVVIDCSGQELHNIESYDVFEERSTIAIKTKDNQQISLRFSNDVDSLTRIFADENFCIIVSRNGNSICVSSSYKLDDGEWYQDYTNRNIFYPSNGLFNTEILEVDILDGSTLTVKYEIVNHSGEKDQVLSKVILGDKSFVDSESGTTYSYMIEGSVHSLRQPVSALIKECIRNKE